MKRAVATKKKEKYWTITESTFDKNDSSLERSVYCFYSFYFNHPKQQLEEEIERIELRTKKNSHSMSWN